MPLTKYPSGAIISLVMVKSYRDCLNNMFFNHISLSFAYLSKDPGRNTSACFIVSIDIEARKPTASILGRIDASVRPWRWSWPFNLWKEVKRLLVRSLVDWYWQEPDAKFPKTFEEPHFLSRLISRYASIFKLGSNCELQVGRLRKGSHLIINASPT